jgi:AcrR family transcriptional regulator
MKSSQREGACVTDVRRFQDVEADHPPSLEGEHSMASTPQTSRRTAQGEASRKRLIEAALKLFSDHGYAGASVDAICKEAGVVKTALYWHFGSKDGLLSATVDYVADQWVSEIEGAVDAEEHGPNRIDELLKGMRKLVDERIHLLQVVEAIVNERGHVAPEALEAVRRLNKRAVAALERGFNRAVGMELPDMTVMGQQIIGMLHGARRWRCIDPDAWSAHADTYFVSMRKAIVLMTRDRIAQAGEASRKSGDG